MTTPLYRYIGPDTFPNVPARDLAEDEFTALPILTQLDIKANSSYEEHQEVDLGRLERDELNDLAAKAGVESPGDLKNKAEVIKAIEAAGSGNEEVN